MNDIEKIDNELYKEIYCLPNGNYNKIWSRIKNNPQILREAVQIEKDELGKKYDIVKGVTISELILIDHKSVDEVAYNNLIAAIYTNIDIARLVINGSSNGGYSFLLMSLWNHNLKLTEAQKTFAVNEAMNKIGTIRWHQKKAEYSEKLADIGVSNDNETLIDVDGFIQPIGQKTSLEYMNYMFSLLSREQAHGTGEFDIRYHILRNPNWTLEEKQKLIMDFWYDDETYADYLDEWKWAIVNDYANYKGKTLSQLDEYYLYDYTYEELLKFYEDNETTDRIYNEIQFCKQMNKLRPPYQDGKHTIKKKILV